MDSHEWKAQVQSDHREPSAKLPKLQLEDHRQWHQYQFQSPSSALTLFTPSEPSNNVDKTTATTTHLSTFPYPKMSLEQWQELQLQALIYKYMISGVSVPLELIFQIKRCLSTQPRCYYHSHLHQHFRPSVFQSGWWGRCVLDSEPGRCRRTDGKKWRCSREVMKGQKYCERHVHRGRNRSRKHVEAPSPSHTSCFKTTTPLGTAKEEAQLSINVSLHPLDMLNHDKRIPEYKGVEGDVQNNSLNVSALLSLDNRGDRHVLRSFFDEWPKSQGELNATGKAGHSSSAVHSSVSVPGNSSSDISLRLSTGIHQQEMKDSEEAVQQQTSANWLGWGSAGGASSMGGPLAEALHPLTLSSSPTSVLNL